MSSNIRKICLIVASTALVISTASAIDINSSRALQYYGNNDLDFQVDETGNAKLTNGGLNITGIANLSEKGVEIYQPLSVESSGPLSVANGVDLTGTDSNTIDSYSTLYLQTSSGSPSDIVLDPSGVVGTTSDLDLGENNLTGVGGIEDCGANEFLNGNGKCEVDTDTDTTLTEDEVEQFVFDTGDNDQGDLGLNGNSIVDTTDNEVSVNDDLTLEGNDINNIANLESLSINSATVGNVNQLNNAGGNLDLQNVGTASRVEVGAGSGSVTTDFNGNLVQNVGALDLDSTGDIRTDGTDALRIDSGQNVDVPNGDIRALNGNRVLAASSTDSGRYVFIEHDGTNGRLRTNWGDLHLTTGDGTKTLDLVNGGNIQVPNGDLSLQNNRVTGIGTNGANFRSSGTLDLEGSSVVNTNQIISSTNGLARVQFNSGVDIEVDDGTGTRVDALRTDTGGDVTVPNGEINANGGNVDINNGNNLRIDGRIQEIGGKDSNNIYDDGDLTVDTDDKIEFADSGTTYMEIGGGATEGNTQISDQGDITTQGRLDANTEGGEISSSGTEMDVKSNGNVVMTLG